MIEEARAAGTLPEVLPVAPPGLATRPHGFLLQILRRLIRSKGGLTGGGFIIALVFAAAFAPWVAPYDPIEISPADALQKPSWRHPCGTDRFGRDIFSRIIFGSRISL